MSQVRPSSLQFRTRRSGPSPHLQGRGHDAPRTVFVGIDVSLDRLDVHLLPSGEAFAVPRNGTGRDELAGRTHRLAVARSSRGLRRLEHGVPPLQALEHKGVMAAHLRGDVDPQHAFHEHVVVAVRQAFWSGRPIISSAIRSHAASSVPSDPVSPRTPPEGQS